MNLSGDRNGYKSPEDAVYANFSLAAECKTFLRFSGYMKGPRPLSIASHVCVLSEKKNRLKCTTETVALWAHF